MKSKDFDYFLQNMSEFYKNHAKKFLAIKGQNVIGVYDTFDKALDTTLKTEELGTFLIQKCVKNKEEMAHHFQYNVSPQPIK
jgi:hypothetical protein